MASASSASIISSSRRARRSRKDADHPAAVTLFISTVKTGALVILRLDRVEEKAAAS
jgi:hypothetical protein